MSNESRLPEQGSARGMDALKDPSPDFVERVLAIVQTIPPGRVMTYGGIAAMLADHAALAGTEDSSKARLVGQSMARCGAELRARGRKTLVLTQGPVRLHLGHGRT